MRAWTIALVPFVTLLVTGCDIEDARIDGEDPPSDDSVDFRCPCLQSPFTGASYGSNWSENKDEHVIHPVGDFVDDDFWWDSVSHGYWSGSTWIETNAVSEIRVTDEGKLEINLGSAVSPNWSSPVSGANRITRFHIKGDASNNLEQFEKYYHVTAVYGPTTVNGQSVYQYAVRDNGLGMIGLGDPLCYDHGDGNTNVVLLPNVHLSEPAPNSAVLVAKSSTDFTMACSSTSTGKGRVAEGILPNSGALNYTVTRYNAFIRAAAAWYNNTANTTHGTPVYFKDLYNNPPWFGAGIQESSTYGQGTPVTWTGHLLEAAYSEKGARCRATYANTPFPGCLVWPDGVHRSGSLPANSTTLSICNQNPGSGGVAIYIDRTANDGACEF